MCFLSIITVCYNNKKGLERTLSSVLPLPNNCEWIIIDADSCDGTKDLLEGLPKQKNIKYISEPDNGIFDGMNKGVALAKGLYLNFMNSGDCFYRETLENIINMKSYSADVMVFDYIALDANLNIQKALQLPINPKKLKQRGCVPHQSTLIKRSLFGELGQYDLKYRYSADYEFFVRVYSEKKFTFKFFPNIYLAYFFLDGITGNLKLSLKQGLEVFKIQKKYFGRSNYQILLVFFLKYLLSFLPFGSNIFFILRTVMLKNRKDASSLQV